MYILLFIQKTTLSCEIIFCEQSQFEQAKK